MKKYIEPNTEVMSVLQLLLPLWLTLAIFSSAPWYMYALSFFFWFLYCAIGNNLAMHRYFCHDQFTVSLPVEILFLWSSAMSGLGSPLSYALPHLVHHKYPDTDLDPHGPTVGIKSLLYYFHRHVHLSNVTLFGRRIAQLVKRYSWLHRTYWLFVIGNVALMWAIGGWTVVLFCWLIPSGLTLWAVSGTIYLQHTLCDGTYQATDTQKYSWWGWGEGLHATHHRFPRTANNATKLGQVDYTYQLSRIFAKKYHEPS